MLELQASVILVMVILDSSDEGKLVYTDR